MRVIDGSVIFESYGKPEYPVISRDHSQIVAIWNMPNRTQIGRKIATGSLTFSEIEMPTNMKVTKRAISNDGSAFALYAIGDASLFVDGEVIRLPGFTRTHFMFSDSQLLTIKSEEALKVFDLQSGSFVHELPPLEARHAQYGDGLLFLPSPRQLNFFDPRSGESRKFAILDREIKSIGHTTKVSMLITNIRDAFLFNFENETSTVLDMRITGTGNVDFDKNIFWVKSKDEELRWQIQKLDRFGEISKSITPLESHVSIVTLRISNDYYFCHDCRPIR